MLLRSLMVVMVTLAAAQVSAATTLDFGAVPCQECPQVTLKHYEARGCEPVFDDAVSLCCPASFRCKTEEERGISQDSCIYDNVTYSVRDDVPVTNPCQQGCFCREGFEGAQAKVECAQVECPSLFQRTQPNCRLIYNIENCCEIDQECTNETIVAPSGVEDDNTTTTVETPTLREAGCESEGKQYLLGDKIYFDSEPCQYCVCTNNFTNAFGPNCTTISCGIEYHFRTELRDGCTPIYFNGSCCNIDWICPNSTKVKPEADQVSTGNETPATHCTLGNIVAPRNATLPTDNCNLNCICSTPPDFTCIQYANCDDAAEALKTRRLF